MVAHWGFGLIALFFWLIVMVGVVALVVLIVRAAVQPPRPMPPPGYPAPPGPPPAPREGPLDILARRFASGEISAEEYQKARDLLKE